MKDKRDKDNGFVQEYAYVEDYSLYYKPKDTQKEKDEHWGVVEIDINDATTFEI